MKNLYALLFFLIATTPVMAQQMFVEKESDTETIEFSKLDKITFSGTTVNITQTDGTTSQATMGEINRIHFSNYDSVENLPANSSLLFSYISNEFIEIYCNAGDIIEIYNVMGSKLLCIRQETDNGIISISQLPKGIYIIKVNERTTKFVKR